MICHCRFGLVLLGVTVVVSTDAVLGGEEPSVPNVQAQEYVHFALKYEAEGDTDARDIVLRETLKVAPDYAPVNWHSGRVQRGSRWMPVDEVRQHAATDQTLAQYRELRDRAAGDVQRQLQLARWCARAGMPERSELHYAHLLRNPQADQKTREEAIKKLNLRNVGGLLLTDQQVKQQQEAARQIETAMKQWRPRFEDWRMSLESDNEKKQNFAASQLQQIDDPQVIPVAETFLGDSGPRFGEQLVSLAGGFAEYEATPTLVRFSVLSPWANVRAAAVRELKKRPLHDFFPMLLDGLTAPIQSQWRIFQDPVGNVRYQHLVIREGQTENAAIAFEHVAVPDRMPSRIEGQKVREKTFQVPSDLPKFDPDDWYDPDFTSVYSYVQGIGLQRTRQEQLQALAALAQAARREQQLAMHNAVASRANELVFQVLEETSGAVVLRNPTDWWLWWEKYNETVKPKPTRYVYRPTVSNYERFTGYEQIERTTVRGRWVYPNHSCFAPGTKVWTETGLVPVEDVRIGDNVYAQDPSTGELSLKLVVNTTIGVPTSPLVKLNVEGEDILPTLGHVTWLNGEGWRIAKNLNVGDYLHGMSGGLQVLATEQLPAPDLVYNLVVEDFHTYFVGECGLLVHDITYRQPTRAIVPGLWPE